MVGRNMVVFCVLRHLRVFEYIIKKNMRLCDVYCSYGADTPGPGISQSSEGKGSEGSEVEGSEVELLAPMPKSNWRGYAPAKRPLIGE